MRRGELDAIVHLDPVIQQLEATGDIVVIVDTRTEAGAHAVYGGPYHAACLYAKTNFIADHPGTTQALVNALVRALYWLARASPDEIVAAVPSDYWGSDRAGYQAALVKNLPALSPTGDLAGSGAENVLRVLREFEPFVRDAEIDLAHTFNTTFVTHAATHPK
ncbi:MAG: hypothetical protein EXR86_01485 [Gammaproteobacteria bacterium]|nr:hypothetical protein [Gammaproteobacteria bacterium]